MERPWPSEISSYDNGLEAKMLGFSPRLNLSKTFACEECWKEGRGFLRGENGRKTNARYFSRGNNSMAKVFYKNFSLCCELTNFAVEKVSISNPLFPCVFPFDFPLAIMHHPLDQRSSNLFIPRRKGNNIASRYRFRLRFDPTPLCFPCKILPRISYPGLYSSPFFFFSLFFFIRIFLTILYVSS